MMKYSLINLFLIATTVFIFVTIFKTFLIKYAASSNGYKNIAAISFGLLSACTCMAGMKVIFVIQDILNVIKCQGTDPKLDSKLVFLKDELFSSCILTLIFLALFLFFMINIKKEIRIKINSPKRRWNWKRLKKSLES